MAGPILMRLGRRPWGAILGGLLLRFGGGDGRRVGGRAGVGFTAGPGGEVMAQALAPGGARGWIGLARP